MRIALFASLLLALACGGDDGLTVSGQVAVDAGGTPTGFDFVETTKLVDLTHEEDSGTVMAGRCRVSDGIDDSVTLTLQAPGAPPEGVGLHRFEVVFSDILPASVQAQLGALARDEGDTARAIRHYRESLRLEPDRISAANNLSWILATASWARRTAARAARSALSAVRLKIGNDQVSAAV